MEKRLKLLFAAQKINEDTELAFVTQWVEEFIAVGYDVTVVCFEKGEHTHNFKVVSLGKEHGAGRFHQLFIFLRLITSGHFDRIFVHMIPEFITMGGWWWKLKGTPVYLWYTHYAYHLHIKLAGIICRRMFAATSQSLPQFEKNNKKVVTGHGIDVNYWYKENLCTQHRKLLMVHRISRSKRIELGITALKYLDEDYALTIYGRIVDREYHNELILLAEKIGVKDRVFFEGPVSPDTLRRIYPVHKIMINMASETIDKTMLEAMCNGVYPITTAANSKAIGLAGGINEDTPEAIANFINTGSVNRMSQTELVDIVKTNHSLDSLVRNMDAYIKPGI